MIKSFQKALDSIFKIEITKDYSLSNIEEAVKILWNPQNNFKIIHIAWTNWKWSVSKMIFSILKNSWKKVWVFTSPHLISIKERFETENWKITEEEFIKILNKIINLNIELSYFDKCVLIAFEFFKLKKCEYIILEVWVWWKLDTTNIVNPFLTIIASIWIDHQNLLWNTIEEISEQKAWIIKKNIPIILNFKNKIIEEKAELENAEIIFSDKKIKTNLLWEFQEKNAWLAYEAWKFLWIENKKILEWLKKVDHKWRLEFIKKNLLIDWAHNIDWLKELKYFIKKNLEKKIKKIFYCFSVKKWKNPEMIKKIFWKNKNYIFLDIKSEILEPVNNYKNIFEIKTKKFILEEVEKNPENLYIIFWSLYMIWEFY